MYLIYNQRTRKRRLIGYQSCQNEVTCQPSQSCPPCLPDKDLVVKLKEASGRNQQLAEQISLIENEISKLRKSASSCIDNSSAVEKLEKANKVLQERLSTSLKEKGLLQANRLIVQQCQNKLKGVEERLQSCSRESPEIQNIMQELNEVRVSNNALVNEANKVPLLVRQLEDLRDQSSSLQQQLDTCSRSSEAFERLKIEHEGIKATLVSTQDKLKDAENAKRLSAIAQRDMDNLTAQLAQASAKISQLEQARVVDANCNDNLSAIRSTLTLAQERVNFLEGQLQTSEVSLGNVVREKSSLLERNELLQGKIDELTKALLALQSARQDVVAEITATCDEARSRLAQNMEYIRKRWTAVQRLDSSKSEAWIELRNKHGRLFTNMERMVDSQFDSVTSCPDIEYALSVVLGVVKGLLDIEDVMSNIYEDIAGATRTYVRVRQTSGAPIVQKDGRWINLNGESCGMPQRKRYGPFFGVMPASFTNENVYTGCSSISSCCADDGTDDPPAGFCRVANQLSHGYHVCLIGYGISGSGKTFTLFGDATMGVPGLLQLTIQNTDAQVQLMSIYELEAQQVKILKNGLIGKVSLLLGTAPSLKDPQNEFLTETITPLLEPHLVSQGLSSKGVLAGSVTPDVVHKLVTALTNFRIKRKNIKPTPNNPQSSRSHLFCTFRFTFKNGKKGYLTVVDMAGGESPYAIMDTLYDKDIPTRQWNLKSYLLNLPLNGGTLHRFQASDTALRWLPDVRQRQMLASALNNLTEKDRIDITAEGIFINETINQLVYYLIERTHGTTQADSTVKVNKWNSINNGVYDPHMFFSGKPNSDVGKSIGMYRLMKYLDGLGGGGKLPTKFVLMTTVRGEETYCNMTAETLDFVELVKAT